MIKSWQLKKSMNNLCSNSCTKGNKLKFESIKTQEELHTLTINDQINIQQIYQFLQQLIKDKKTPYHQILSMNYELMKKLKKIIKEKENQKNQQSKIKFRIVKSAKKNAVNIWNNIKKKQFQYQNHMHIFHQCHSSDLMNKQNIKNFQGNSVIAGESLINNCGGKGKYKRNMDNKGSLGEYATIKLVSTEEIVKKLKNQIKKISINYSEACKKNQILTEKLREIEKEKQKMQQMQQKLSKLQQLKNQQKINLSVKFSLKCIQKQEIEESDHQTQNNSLSPPKCESNQDNKRTKCQQISENQVKHYEKLYHQQKQKHLQLIIVSQSKQLQVLQKKLAEKLVNLKQNKKHLNNN